MQELSKGKIFIKEIYMIENFSELNVEKNNFKYKKSAFYEALFGK